MVGHRLRRMRRNLVNTVNDIAERDHVDDRLSALRPQAAGLCWHSRQLTAQTAYVLYSSPVDPNTALDVISSTALDEPEGWRLIGEALKIVGVERLGSAALAQELLAELPPEEPGDDY